MIVHAVLGTLLAVAWVRIREGMPKRHLSSYWDSTDRLIIGGLAALHLVTSVALFTAI